MFKDKRITLATLKSFIKKNADKIYIKELSKFNGMIDCVSNVVDDFKHTIFDATNHKSTLGYNGIWLVGRSDDRFTAFENSQYIGIEVYNCCGNFIVAIQKG